MHRAVVLHTHVAGLGVIRALGRMGVPIIAMWYEGREMGYVSKYATETIRVPHPESQQKDFIDRLLFYGKKYPSALLIPTNDFTVSVISRHKDVLASHYIVAVPEWKTTKKVLVKKYTYRIAEAFGISYPKTFVPKSLENVLAVSDRIGFPYLMKPCEGHKFFETYGTKMFTIFNQEEAVSRFRRIMDEKLEIMIQEIIPGDDTQGINYNAYFVDGSPIAEFTARKVRLDPPRFGSPRVLVSERIPEIIETGRRLIRAIGFNGFTCTEFKRDARDGVYKLMEVNGRHNLTTSLAVECGINFPRIMYEHLCRRRIIHARDFDTGVYWIDTWKDIIHTVWSRKYENFTFMDYLRPYFSRKVLGVFSLEDLKPVLKRTVWVLSRVFKSFFRPLTFDTFKEKVRKFTVGKAY